MSKLTHDFRPKRIRPDLCETCGGMKITAEHGYDMKAEVAKQTLDHLIRIQDALDALDDTSCITRADFVEANKRDVQHLYAAAWEDARKLVREHGSLRSAAQYIAKRIDALRTPDFTVQNEGTIYLLTPHTDAAREWVQEHIETDDWSIGPQHFGDSIAVDHRYIADIVRGIQADGLEVR